MNFAAGYLRSVVQGDATILVQALRSMRPYCKLSTDRLRALYCLGERAIQKPWEFKLISGSWLVFLSLVMYSWTGCLANTSWFWVRGCGEPAVTGQPRESQWPCMGRCETCPAHGCTCDSTCLLRGVTILSAPLSHAVSAIREFCVTFHGPTWTPSRHPPSGDPLVGPLAPQEAPGALSGHWPSGAVSKSPSSQSPGETAGMSWAESPKTHLHRTPCVGACAVAHGAAARLPCPFTSHIFFCYRPPSLPPPLLRTPRAHPLPLDDAGAGALLTAAAACPAATGASMCGGGRGAPPPAQIQRAAHSPAPPGSRPPPPMARKRQRWAGMWQSGP